MATERFPYHIGAPVDQGETTTEQRSPLSVTAPTLQYLSPARDGEDSAREISERVATLPVFADLIRASVLANGQATSPLPSLAKTSIGFILGGGERKLQTPPVVGDVRLEPPRSPNSDGESLGRASMSSIVSTPTLSPRDSTSSNEDASKLKVRPASRTCKAAGCNQYVVDHGLCVRHGGGKRCTMEGCTSRAKHYGRCWRHGGSMECKISDCANRAKSRGYCWSHGGGTKCKADDCEKIAISNGLCWAHGGGKRCAATGCMKQAYERTDNLCNSHFQQTKRAAQRH